MSSIQHERWPSRRLEFGYLEELHDLNQLFLMELKRRAEAGQDCFGLPRTVHLSLREATPGMLDRAAEFPCALFRLSIGGDGREGALRDADNAAGWALASLKLTVLHRVWNYCRTKRYVVRAHFGLADRDVEALQHTPLVDLLELFRRSTIVANAFDDAGRFWRELIEQANAKSRRHLVLVGLQPTTETQHSTRAIKSRAHSR
jgi:hypothetical protein